MQSLDSSNVIKGTVSFCIHPHIYDNSLISNVYEQEKKKFKANKRKIRARLTWLKKARSLDGQPRCIPYEAGVCKQSAETCRFHHPATCIHWINNACKYEEDCPYHHMRLQEPNVYFGQGPRNQAPDPAHHGDLYCALITKPTKECSVER